MPIAYIQKHLVIQTAFEQDENYKNDHLLVLFEHHFVQTTAGKFLLLLLLVIIKNNKHHVIPSLL